MSPVSSTGETMSTGEQLYFIMAIAAFVAFALTVVYVDRKTNG